MSMQQLWKTLALKATTAALQDPVPGRLPYLSVVPVELEDVPDNVQATLVTVQWKCHVVMCAHTSQVLDVDACEDDHGNSLTPVMLKVSCSGDTTHQEKWLDTSCLSNRFSNAEDGILCQWRRGTALAVLYEYRRHA